MRYSLFFLAIALLVLDIASPALVRADTGPHVRLTLATAQATIVGGQTVRIGIRQDIAPGWHTYWVNPGDAGQPMHVRWTLPAGFTISDVRWPAPRRLEAGGITSFGYETTVMPVATLTAPGKLPAGPLTIRGETETLVCKDICIPQFGRLEFTFNADGKADPTIKLAAAALPQAIQARVDGPGSVSVTLTGLGPHFDPSRRIELLPYEWGSLDTGVPIGISVKDNRVTFRYAPGAKPLTAPRLLLTQPATGLAYDVIYETPPVTARRTPSVFAARSTASLPMALVLALLGGLILNLMPCVFPVLSIKAMGLARLRDQERGHAVRHGLAYTGGILLCFFSLAAVLLSLKGAGAEIGWGFQLQTPQVVLALAWLLFAIGLSFSGLFELGSGMMNLGQALTRREGAFGSFCTGLLAAIVATPCTAPFMAAAVGYALVQPPAVAMAVFLALGFGLALPYLLICLSPALQRLLPRPGQWMVAVKEFLAFPMYASAAWLTWVYTQQTGPDGVLYALSGMVLLGLIIWLTVHLPGKTGGRAARRGMYMLAGVSMAGLLVLAWNANVTDRALTRGRTVQGPLPATSFEKFSPDALRAALAGPDPIFVDMTAAWCLTCKINERVALGQPSVKALFRDRHVRVFIGDWTNQDAAITAYLQGFGRQGVPLYVFYGPPGADGIRPSPMMLPQILTPGEVRKVVAPPIQPANPL